MRIEVDYLPQQHQRQLHDCNVSLVAVTGRQVGKTVSAVNELIKRAVMVKESRNWYVTNDYRQAKRNVWELLLKYLPKELVREANKSDLTVNLVNGSKIELIGVENAEKLRGAAVHFMILDEYADFKDGVFEKVLEPMLTTTNGQMWFLGCVTKETLVMGESGLKEIGENQIGYTDNKESFYGIGGFHQATHRYGSPERDTIRLKTAKGFEIEGTTNHKLLVHEGWKRLDEFNEGDFVCIQSENNVFGKATLKDDMAYLIGLYLAEGCIEYYKTKKGLKPSRITITNNESGDFLTKIGFKSRDNIHWRKSDKKLADFILKYVAGGKAPNKFLSDLALSLDKKSMKALLQGYFDGDGFADSKKSRIGSTSSSKKLSKQVQMLLLNFGVLATLSEVETPPTKKSKVSSVGYRVVAEGHGAYKFHKEIGFRIERKAQKADICEKSKKNSYQVFFDKTDFKTYVGSVRSGIKKTQKTISVFRLKRILEQQPNSKYNPLLLADKVISISKSRARTNDFVIPQTHSYFSNGFISHNTPKGLGNDFYFKYIEDNHFRKFKFPSCRIQGGRVVEVLSEYTSIEKMQEIYDRAVKEGKLDYFNQEHLAEFTRPSGTVYKEWSIDNYKDFDYDENLPLHLTFDFGVNDPTAIIWIQPKGSETRVIDYYEATNADINHFIQVLKSKPYKSPEFCAGDIAGRATDLTSGKSPISMLREAGYYIKTSHIPNIPAQVRQTHTKIAHLYINHQSSRFKDIILNYRYPEVKTDIRNQSNEIPLHNEWSHGARAFEYWCWNYEPPEQEMTGIKKVNSGQMILDRIEENRKAREYLSWI